MTHEEIIKAAEAYAMKQSANGNNASDYDLAKADFIAGAEWANKNQTSPWISVKERLPKEGETVITRIVYIVEGGGECDESVQHIEQKYKGRWMTDNMKQYRRGDVLYDTISKVTHWMPISLNEDRP